MQLEWKDNASDESGYKVERKEGSGQYTLITTLSSNTVTYTDSGLDYAETYTYRVKASNYKGDFGNSNEATVTLKRPGLSGKKMMKLPSSIMSLSPPASNPN